ncbi:MAG TPA: hypothetical protein VIK01_22095 [Polyangiaceae bacterium]
MRTWGQSTSVVGLWLAIACAGKAPSDPASGGASGALGSENNAAGAAGALNSAGAGDTAGYVGDCQPSFRGKCFSDCTTQVPVDMDCENGVWNCPPGTTAPVQCPPTPCPNTTAACCAPGAAIATPLMCDALGDQQSCPAGSTFGTKAGDPCPMPDYCDVAASTDLAGKDCSFLDSTCFFDHGCAYDTCACTQSDAGNPTWACQYTNCTMR